MSTSDEKARALIQARQFMQKLLSPYDGGYKKVPKEVRQAATSALRHFPNYFDVKIICDYCGVWGTVDQDGTYSCCQSKSEQRRIKIMKEGKGR